MTSTDGVTWTKPTPPNTNKWWSVTYGTPGGTGRFVAVGYDGAGTRVMTSTDGTNWSTADVTGVEANARRSVTYGNGTFVAVASGGTNRVMTSTDGLAWTPRSAAAARDWFGVTCGNGTFVAVAQVGFGGGTAATQVMTSTDGISWTSRAAAAASNWYGVTYGNGTFVAVSISTTGSGRVMTSPDGITWTMQSHPTDTLTSKWYGVTYGSGQFVAVASTGTDRVMTSPG